MQDHNEFDLTTPVQFLKGVGPKRAGALKSVGIETIEGLLYYIPRRYLDRSNVLPISRLPLGEDVTVIGKVEVFGIKEGRRDRFILILSDGTGFLNCVWFQGLRYLSNLFSIGDTVAVSGRVTFFKGKQIVHPEFEIISSKEDEDLLHTGRIIPLYPSTAQLREKSLDSRGLRRIIKPALDRFAPYIPETLPASILERNRIMSRSEALYAVHFPDSLEEAERARQRLAFEEFFYLQLMLALKRRERMTDSEGIVFTRIGTLVSKLLERLSFELTEAQKRVLHEIRADMKSPRPMNRLLQGDVGSGKTMVALITMLIAIENGYQAVLMAPTEVLAEQHFLTIHGLLEELSVKVCLLIGKMSKAQREGVLSWIANGDVQIIIGTHALLEEAVEFHRLGLVVIDEQHKFGVMQRAALRSKGSRPDVLVMTATPIPRSLALTLYGDLDSSVLDELPPGRRPVRTVWRPDSKREEVLDFIRRELRKGRQAYIVYPLVEESEKSDLKAATESYEKLKEGPLAGFHLALLHGRMKTEEKEAVMAAFKSGEIDVLVSTTVIEVGVDVPNASVMVVEHAERFGLSQLHQLRGRVGRGPHQSYCILLASYPLSEEAKMRLGTMCRTNDGFKIAETDLELRGPGEFFGTRQWGMPELKFGDILKDSHLLSRARREAFALVEVDPTLREDENLVVRQTLSRLHKGRMELIEVG